MIYIASPYSSPSTETRVWRFEKVQHFNAVLIQSGQVAYSPIAHLHPLAEQHELPTDAAWWEFFNRSIFERCDSIALLMLPGWQTSIGVAMEIGWAAELGKTLVKYNQEFERVENGTDH